MAHGQYICGCCWAREEENLRVAVRADVHRMDPESLLDTGAAPRLQVQAQRRGWWYVGQNPHQAPRGFWLFSGHLVLSAARCLLSGRGPRCCFSIWCGLAALLGSGVLRMLEGFTGFQNALCSSRAISQDPQQVGFEWGVSWPFSSPPCQGFMYEEREGGAEEWMRGFIGIMWGRWANPSALFTRDTWGNFLLTFWDEPLFSVWPQCYGGLTDELRSDELSRVDWYHQENSLRVPSWLPTLRVLSLSQCCGCGKSFFGKANPGQTTTQCHRWPPN